MSNTQLSVDLTTLSNWSNVPVGENLQLTIVAKASGYGDSNPSTAVSLTVRSITPTLTNVTASASNPSTIVSGGTATLNFTADGTSYKMPTSITVGSTTVPAGTETTVSGVATFLYTRTSDTAGSVAISNPTSNVSFTVVGEAVSSGYSGTITYTFSPMQNGYQHAKFDTAPTSDDDCDIKTDDGLKPAQYSNKSKVYIWCYDGSTGGYVTYNGTDYTITGTYTNPTIITLVGNDLDFKFVFGGIV